MTTKVKKSPAKTTDSALPGLADEPAGYTEVSVTKVAASTRKKTAEGLFRGYDELADVGKENLEAFLKANTVLADGMERIGKEVIGLTRQSLESAAAATSALLDAKSIEDVMALQGDFTKSFVDQVLAGTAKLSEMGLKVASDAYDPLTQRVEQTLAQFGRSVAA